jgi:phage shock protein PspC (stress-responsive transcriptional regulator)
MVSSFVLICAEEAAGVCGGVGDIFGTQRFQHGA